MVMFLRFALCFVLLVGCTIGISYSQPEWIAALGLDFWKLPELNFRINKASEKGENLDRRIDTMMKESQYKTKIVEDLIADRLPLAEAVVMVQEVTSQESMEMILSSVEVKETTLNGKAARMLIYWVGQELKRDPEKRNAVCARLENELKEGVSMWN